MKLRYPILLIFVIFLITSCKGEVQRPEEPLAIDPTPQFEYKIGLRYGFLGKVVQVSINDHEVISLIGSKEIEDYAQLQGTMMLASGSSPTKEVKVQVTVNGGRPYEQTINLIDGMYVHIYLEGTGLRVFNTHFLVLE